MGNQRENIQHVVILLVVNHLPQGDIQPLRALQDIAMPTIIKTGIRPPPIQANNFELKSITL